MNPRLIQDWIDSVNDKAHSMAVKYIEKNVDLIDTDLQKFMDDCPTSCRFEVYEMLVKAGIDMTDCVVDKSYYHKKIVGGRDVNCANPYLKQLYTIEYKEKLDKYITETLTWKTDWRHDAIVLDTIPAVEEA